MFGIFESEPSLLDKEIDRVTRDLNHHLVDSEEYAARMDQLIRLHKLRNEEKSQRVKPDTWILAGTNLLGILMVIRHEHVNVITSRAMAMIPKTK